MKNFLKIFIFIMIIFLTPKVFAASQNISQKIEATPNFGGGTYYATQPVAVPVPLYQNIGTKYNGKLSLIEFYLDNSDWDWNYNKTYTITLNMATEDWRNNFMGPQVIQCNCDGSQQSTSTSSFVSNTFRFVSYKTIKFNFKLGSTMGCKTKFRIYSGNTSTTAITGVSNYNLSSIVISDTTSAPTPTPVAPVPTPTSTASNQDIINNQAQNTQDIIDNNTQNTADIIENNNSNTEIINNSLNSNCKNGPLTITPDLIEFDNKYLNSSGQQLDDTGAGISKFLIVKGGGTYKFNFPSGPPGSSYQMCEYGSNKQLLSGGCRSLSNLGTEFTLSNYTQYIRITIYKSWWFQMSLDGPICNNWEQEGLNSINDSINNSSVDDKTGFFTNFNNDMHGLSGIITLPLSTIQSLTNNSCVSLNIPIPFTNDSIDLPCMSQLYDDYAHDIFNLWQVVSFGIISYYICLDIFKMVKGFKDPNDDKIEVLDL